MKCPYCGNESDGKDICGKCGRRVEIPRQEIEVEYKEFKISEFMEIRKKRQGSLPKETAANAEITAKPAKPGTVYGNRKLFITLFAVLVLAVAAVVYYIVKFLFKK